MGEATMKSAEVQLMDSMFREKFVADKMAAAGAENHQLKNKIGEIQAEAEQSQTKQTDLIWFYRNENEQKDKIIAVLTQNNQKLEVSMREIKEKADEEIKRMESQNSYVKKELQEHLEKLTRESKSLSEFREQKRQLEMELSVLKNATEQEQKEMTRKLNDLERHNVSEKERLKKEMLRKIKETKLSLLAMTEDQLHTTTKRAIMENEQMTIELQYQSKETERLLAKNAKLNKEKQVLKRELELSKETETILAKRTNFFQKLIKKLNAKSKSNDKLIFELESSQKASAKNSARNMFVENQVIHQLETQIQNAEFAMQTAKAENAVLLGQYHSAKNSLSRFLSLQDESITFIWSEVERIRERIRQDGGDGVANLDHANREKFLNTLFTRLRSLRESFANDIYTGFDDEFDDEFDKPMDATSPRLDPTMETSKESDKTTGFP